MENKEKRAVVPSYFEAFKCIGGACEDTCCAGWYLPVDEATYKKYKKVKHPEMRRRLDKEIVHKKGAVDPSHVAKIKQKNGRCAFLNQEGWCQVYTELGEKYLSESCTFYPRTANQVNGLYEYSLTLSCIEAARQVLNQPEGISFTQEVVCQPIPTISAKLDCQIAKPKRWEDYFEEYRKAMFEVLKDRKLPLNDRLAELRALMEEVDYTIKKHDLKKLKEVLVKRKKASQPLSSFDAEQFDKMQKCFKEFVEDKKLHSRSYKETLSQIITMNYAVYQETYAKYHAYSEGTIDYLLENYLVNYVYERCVPLDAKTPSESIERLLAYYTLIELHLVGIFAQEGEITQARVVELIQGFTKVYDHGENYMAKLLNCL